MSRPKIICMDEPTMGLSPKLVEDVLEQIARLRDELGVSVLMVEQQAELALSIADYGYVLQNGRIRLHGKAGDLLGNERVQEAYLGRSETMSEAERIETSSHPSVIAVTQRRFR